MKKIEPIKKPQKIFNYWAKEKKALFLVAISGTLYNVGMLASPICQGQLIDALANNLGLKEVLGKALFFISAVLIVMLFRYIKRFYVRRFANNTNATMRLIIYNNIVYKSERELNSGDAGVLMSKVIADVDACVEGMRKFTTEIFDTGVLLFAYLVAMVRYEWRLTLISVFFVVLAITIAEKLKTVIVSAASEYRNRQGEISASTFDYIDNAMMYRVFGRENDNKEAYAKSLHEYTGSAVVSGFWETGMQPIYNMISMAGIIFVIAYGSSNVLSKIWTIGDFSAYISIFTAMAIKSSKAAKLFNSVQKAKVSWERICPYLDEYKEPCPITKKFSENIELKFSDVSFKYPNSEYLFKNINMDLKSGDWIGVTGQVATGKSTFGKLMLQEYPYEGKITINGVDIEKLTNGDMCSLISYMGHKPNLISYTIEENITLGNNGNLKKAIDSACLQEDLDNMPEKAKTMVGFKGIMLSGGQAARVALARALYKDSKIVILDDPFSAVDEKTEKEIIKEIKANYNDRIFIILSHRLKMFKLVDKVLLLQENGKTEYASHVELLKISAVYRKLVNLQNEGEQHE